jgi:porphobilinogen synthase
MKILSSFPQRRMRRNRRHEFSRRLMRENGCRPTILFIRSLSSTAKHAPKKVGSMPGVPALHHAIDCYRMRKKCVKLGIPAVAIFPAIEPGLKRADGREAVNPEGPRAESRIRAEE